MQAERITKIRSLGKMPVVDIEVKNEHHLYFQNGIVGHNSHSVSYALTSYQCAFIKAHFPLQFYCAWLSMAQEKLDPQEEIRLLIEDARSNSISIFGPSIFKKNKDFCIFDKNIYFGIGNIKKIGNSAVEKIFNVIEEAEKKSNKPIDKMNWMEFLCLVLLNVGKTSASNLICSGAVSNFDMHRNEMLYEYNKISKLSNKEIKAFEIYNGTSIERLQSILINHDYMSKREDIVKSILDSLKNPPNNITDTNRWVVNVESDLLGLPISCSKLDEIDGASINCKCSEFDMTNVRSLILGVEIVRATEWLPKGAESPMCFLTISDDSGSIEASLSTDDYKEYASLLFSGNIVLVNGFKNKKGNLSIKKVIQL